MSDLLTKKLNGFHLIDASAGTGKTYTITALVVRLLLEKGLGLPQILIVTYTEAAAGDLRRRVREVLLLMRQGYEDGEAQNEFVKDMIARTDLDPEVSLKRIQLALNEFDEAAIFTIHSFCQRSLKENGLESSLPFDMELEKDMAPHEHQVASDYWRRISGDLSAGFLGFAGKALYPDSLVHYFRQIRPDLLIIPEGVGVGDYSSNEERYLDGYSRLVKAWKGARDVIFDLLMTQTGLNAARYKKKSIPVWFVALDDYFADSGTVFPVAPDCLEKFTTANLVLSTKQKSSTPEHPFFDLAESLWEDWQSLKNGYEAQLLFVRRGFYEFATDELNRVKAEEAILSFEDLLLHLQHGLAGPGGARLAASLRLQYPAILIDEFQDTDPVQFKIFAAIHGGDAAHLLYLIGDPKQAIYNFRGADIFAYLKAASSVKNRESLAYNYRSEEGLIAGVNQLFQGLNPFLIAGIEFEPALFPGGSKDRLFVEGDDPAPIQILFGRRDDASQGKKPKAMTVPLSKAQVETGCCAEIIRLLQLAQQGKATIGERAVQPHDIAILVRENKEARSLQRLLLSHGVAAVVKDNESLFAAPQARELFTVLKGVASYRDQRALTMALATDCLGWSAAQLYGLRDDDALVDEVMGRFHRYYTLWQERGFMAMFRALLSGEDVQVRLLAVQGGERSLTNILHLGELLHRQAEKNPAISAVLNYFKLHLQLQSKDDTFEQRLESDSERLQILTIHKAKGLEFPIVFCPFLWRGLKRQKGDPLFHSQEDQQLTLDLGSDDVKSHKEQAQFEARAENLRLAYVALTRATNRCIINWGAYSGYATSPLGYLFHNDDGDAEAVSRRLQGCTDDELHGMIQDHVDGSGSTIAVRHNPTVLESYRASIVSENTPLATARFTGEIDRSFQVTSFSKLTSGHHHESLILDRDQDDDGSGVAGRTGLNLFDFPRGANPGTFLHYLFEHLDFGDLDSGGSQDFIREALQRFGYEEKWQPVMETMLADVCGVRLPGQKFCLADVAQNQRLNELDFHFPLAPVSSGDCADLFRTQQAMGGEPWYAMVESYGFQMLNGFLKGFIDLVFRHEERYFIIDWKSNYLGNHHSAYGEEALLGSMVQSGYILQYHLYCLALHRFLASRLADYDYERHFGGVFYVYLRGVSKENNETGLFHDRPSYECMTALDGLFSGNEEVKR